MGTFNTDTPHASLTDVSVSVMAFLPSITPLTTFVAGFGVSSEVFDTHNLHDKITNAERLTVPVDGKYLVYADVKFVNVPGGGYRRAVIRKNGVLRVAAGYGDAASVSLSYARTVPRRGRLSAVDGGVFLDGQAAPSHRERLAHDRGIGPDFRWIG